MSKASQHSDLKGSTAAELCLLDMASEAQKIGYINLVVALLCVDHISACVIPEYQSTASFEGNKLSK